MEEKEPVSLYFSVIGRILKQKMDERAQQMDLTCVQVRVLGEIHQMEISGMGEIHQRDLEEREHVTHPTMTGILRRLESKGFVYCEPSALDHRSKKISCTDKAREIYREAAGEEQQILEKMFEGFTPEQIAGYVCMTRQVTENILKADI
ncbi:MAG: MarR family transcriptional regulator [Clostridiales bacterium]|nr:MarR family transcriptional regulator [Clostridiales bacterium]